MAIPKFCPICGDILQLIQHTTSTGLVYWQWECPEGDWVEPATAAEVAESGTQSA